MYFLAAILGANMLGQSIARLRHGGTELVVQGKTFVSSGGFHFDVGSLVSLGNDLILQYVDRQEKIDLRAVEKGWFEDDVRWGGNYQATRLRKIAFGGDGGFYTNVSDFAPVGPGKALAILSLTEAAKIQGPQAQVLVALSASPFRIKWIRYLSGMGDGLSAEPAHRLYRFRNHLYLNDTNQISRVDSSGIVVKKICPWSIDLLPLGLVGDRWVISESTNVYDRTLEATDLATGEGRVLFSPTTSSYTLEEIIHPYDLDRSGPYVLYKYSGSAVGTAICHKFLSIHVPDGAVHEIPGDYYTLQSYGPYLVGEIPHSVAKLFFKYGREAGPIELPPF